MKHLVLYETDGVIITMPRPCPFPDRGPRGTNCLDFTDVFWMTLVERGLALRPREDL